ncbi:MAG: transmembrane proteins 14C-domain-containing protein [Monoraphidium minutum]|nr:MAG: transmembrane proteins 14C-domain-containing protein [Monoraphidium minutum]
MAPAGQSHINMTMAALCAFGGVMGAVKKGSKASLIAGLAFGSLYGASAYLVNSGDAAKGFALGFTTSMVLTGTMGQRYVRGGKFMPAGLLTAAGALASLHNGMKYNEWNMG